MHYWYEVHISMQNAREASELEALDFRFLGFWKVTCEGRYFLDLYVFIFVSLPNPITSYPLNSSFIDAVFRIKDLIRTIFDQRA